MTFTLIVAAAFTVFVIKVIPFLIRPWFSPLRQLPGPPNPSWLFGQLRNRFSTENLLKVEQWKAEYGPSFVINGLFGVHRLHTHDMKALHHVLVHSADYVKPAITRYTLSSILGPGVLVVDGEQHKMQRRVMNPAFGPAQIRELTGVIMEKAEQLRDLWRMSLPSDGNAARINVLDGLSRMTLDAIGVAGFGYDFEALNPNSAKPNELNAAFKAIFQENEATLVSMARIFIPPLRLISTNASRRRAEAMETMHRIGMNLIKEKKAAILSEKAGGVEKTDIQGRDLLSLLIKANMATDISEGMRMSDGDILAQVPTFIVAGHETTATAVTWCLFSLSQDAKMQQKLREELLNASDTPNMEELSALPYLDMVVKETLRIHPPVSQTIRVAAKADRIPVSVPYKDKNGVEKDFIEMAAGDLVSIPILALHRDKQIWGEDALEFKPERWEHPPDVIADMPGVWGRLLSFLGGPRACIGYRFALVEMKALLFTLLREFEFELAVKPEDVSKVMTIVQRPLVLSEQEKGSQMPLMVKPYRSG
ncbi:cytochrome P450 [Cristinia sonorae]|uniref:Cytochrome P450 n=1 Tax=Cristinia sonorae TaxID=1940300 RepID=A0A8K0XRX5_9AGAR|nr:cytochrome P450 [Cristinia sonorae]